MKHNVGKTDRIIRVIIAIVLATLYFTKVLTGDLGEIAWVLAAVLIFTATRRCCPIYAILGFGTCQIETKTDPSMPVVKSKPLEL